MKRYSSNTVECGVTSYKILATLGVYLNGKAMLSSYFADQGGGCVRWRDDRGCARETIGDVVIVQFENGEARPDALPVEFAKPAQPAPTAWKNFYCERANAFQQDDNCPHYCPVRSNCSRENAERYQYSVSKTGDVAFRAKPTEAPTHLTAEPTTILAPGADAAVSFGKPQTETPEQMHVDGFVIPADEISWYGKSRGRAFSAFMDGCGTKPCPHCNAELPGSLVNGKGHVGTIADKTADCPHCGFPNHIRCKYKNCGGYVIAQYRDKPRCNKCHNEQDG